MIDFGIYSETDTLNVRPNFIILRPISSYDYSEEWYHNSYSIEDPICHSWPYFYSNLPIVNVFYKDMDGPCARRYFTMHNFLENFNRKKGAWDFAWDYNFNDKTDGKTDVNTIVIDYSYKPKGTWFINHYLSLHKMESMTGYKIIKHSFEFKQVLQKFYKSPTIKWIYGIQ